jgi:hypothetical protein
MIRYTRLIGTSLVVAVAALCAACTSVPVGAPLALTEPAVAPVVAVGDYWNYRVHDGYTGIEQGGERYRVARADASQINVVVIGWGPKAREETQLYDRHWNWLRRPATNLQTFTYNPAYSAFAFPLVPGKTWQTRLYATDPVDGRTFPVRVDGRVVGWERIKVPAGEFDAIRVEREVYFDYSELSVRGGSRINEVEWYSPVAKQSVRRETKSIYWELQAALNDALILADPGGDGGGPAFVPDNWLVYELASYGVK